MKSEEYEKRFERAYQYLVRAHGFFFTWRALQKKKYEQYWKGTNNFWVSVHVALEDSWMLAIAKIYENSSYSKKDKVVSIYSLVRHQKDLKRKSEAKKVLKEQKKILNNIQRIRDHILAHNNAEDKITREDVFRRFPIKYREIEKIFSLTENLFHLLHPESGHSLSMEGFHERCERDTVEVMNAMRFWKEEKQRKIDKSLREFNESLKQN